MRLAGCPPVPVPVPLPELRSTLERICTTGVESTRARYALIGADGAGTTVVWQAPY